MYRGGLFLNLLFIFIMAVTFSCCGSPDVRQSLISSEIKNIPAWTIILTDEYQMQDSLIAINNMERMFKSKYSDKEYCRPYLNTIKENLSSFGHLMVDITGGVGQINLSIRGRKFRGKIDWDTEIDSEQDFRKRHHQDSPADRSVDVGSGAISPAPYIVSDEIADIKLELKGSNGHLLGEVTISDGKINPEFVAAVIDKIIRQGKY